MNNSEISLPRPEVLESHLNTVELGNPLVTETTGWRKTKDALAAFTLSTVMLSPQIAEVADASETRTVSIDSFELAAGGLAERSSYCRARDKVVLVAHRGISEPGGDGSRKVGRRMYTENTIPAVIKGIKLGADASEFDHWRARDGESVVYHDATLGRPDVDPNKGGRVDSHAYNGDLERLKLPSGAKIPTYSQVVRGIDRNTRGGSLQPELKPTRGTHKQKVQWITAMVERAQRYLSDNPRANILFTSRSRGLLNIVNNVSDGTINTGLINFGTKTIPLGSVPKWIDGINNAPNTRGLTRQYVKNARERDITIGIRLVNTKSMFLRAVNKIGARRIITDKPSVINNNC